VTITDFVDASDDHSPFYIMELLEGETIEERLERAGPMSIDEVTHVGKQLASALAATHEKGIIHRDLKPANVFLVERDGDPNFVKLLDYGVAKLENVGGDRPKIQTAVGSLVGTPTYMSPEQTYGVEVDHRADIYGLGLLLYEMLVGKPPFDAETVERVFEQHQGERPVSPSEASGRDVPADLDRLVLACLEKKKRARPESAQDVELLLGRLEQAAFPPVIEGGWSLGALVAVGVLVVATLVIVGVVWSQFETRSAPVEIASAPVREVVPPVAIKIVSEPGGAAVHRQGGASPLGFTPLELRLEASDLPETFELRASGYATVTRTVSSADDSTISVRLSPEAPPEIPAPAVTAEESKPKPKSIRRRRARRRAPPSKNEPGAQEAIDRTETRNPFQ